MKDEKTFLKPPAIAKRYGVSNAKVIGWIRSGELAAINLASRGCTRPRYAVSPESLEQFERARQVVPPAAVPRRVYKAPLNYREFV
jgi:transposase